MKRIVTEQQLQAIIDYVVSVPSGDKPVREVMSIVNMIQTLPTLEEIKEPADPVVEDKPAKK